MFSPDVKVEDNTLTIKVDMDELLDEIDAYANREFAIWSMPVTEGNKGALEFLKKSMLNDILEGKIFAFQ